MIELTLNSMKELEPQKFNYIGDKNVIFLVLLIGLTAVVLFTIFINKRAMISFSESNPFMQKINSWGWVQNPWFCGTVVFLLNGIIFSFILALFFLGAYILLLPLLGIGLSFMLWFAAKQVFREGGLSRYVMSLLGSSFYLILAVYFMIRLITLEPQYEGEDTFMAALGLLIATIITSTAFVIGFITLLLPKRSMQKGVD